LPPGYSPAVPAELDSHTREGCSDNDGRTYSPNRRVPEPPLPEPPLPEPPRRSGCVRLNHQLSYVLTQMVGVPADRGARQIGVRVPRPDRPTL